MQKIVEITIGSASNSRKIRLISDSFDEEDIDLRRCLRIDIANLHYELITFPVILNQVGFLLAELNHKVNMAKLNLETGEATLYEEVRAEYRQDNPGAKELSDEKTTAAMRKKGTWKVLKQLHANAVRDYEFMNSFYWSMKSKDDKLNKLSLSIQAGDIALATRSGQFKKFNYVDISDIAQTE